MAHRDRERLPMVSFSLLEAMAMKLHFLIIDPQNDFSDVEQAALRVPGANADAQRLAHLLNRLQKEIEDIHVTLDTHQLLDIAHPMFWMNGDGQPPAPFTQISVAEVASGKWRAFNPLFQKQALNYVQQLALQGRYELTVWPPHCLIGSWGHGVMPPIQAALGDWEKAHFARVDFVTKGHNPWTEHYSAVQADVPDANDPTTQLNTRLIDTLEQADLIALSGQALSHCVANTVRDIAANFGAESIKKLVLIEDTSSPVPGFEAFARDFVAELSAKGMQCVKSADFLA